MTELEQYIKANFGVSQEDLKEIVQRFKPLKLNKGDYFLHTNTLSDRLAFMHSGLIRIYATMHDREVTQWISTKGYFVTDLASFVFQTPARWNMQALTDCELYSIQWADYQTLGKTIPKWNELDKLFIAKCFVMLEERILSHLYMTAEERYQAFFARQPELFNQVPLQYLASMLGMTPETLSRLRRKQLV